MHTKYLPPSVVRKAWTPVLSTSNSLIKMNRTKLIFIALPLAFALVPSRAAALTETIIPLSASANLRHDSFGYSFTNLYGTTDLYANLNPINDDRAVLEFPIYTITARSARRSRSKNDRLLLPGH